MLLTDSLSQVSADELIQKTIADLASGQATQIDPEIDNWYIFWKASLPFNQSYWYQAPLNDFELTMSYWSYLYDNCPSFQAIIMGSVADQDISILKVYEELPITNITPAQAQQLLDEIRIDSTAHGQFTSPDVPIFIEMLERTATSEWMSWHFDWD